MHVWSAMWGKHDREKCVRESGGKQNAAWKSKNWRLLKISAKESQIVQRLHFYRMIFAIASAVDVLLKESPWNVLNILCTKSRYDDAVVDDVFVVDRIAVLSRYESEWHAAEWHTTHTMRQTDKNLEEISIFHAICSGMFVIEDLDGTNVVHWFGRQ